MADDHYFDRLRQRLREARDTLGGDAQLANDFRQVLNIEHPPLTRRQLPKICAGKDLPLKVAQIEAIDHYLQIRWGVSLSQLWSGRSVVQELVAARTIAFVLGSQPDQNARRIDLSRWDIRAMRDVLNQLYAIGQPLQILFEDVIYRGARTEVLCSGNVPQNESWFHLTGQESGPAIVCLGSPKANHCSEVLLARMLRVRPFEPWPAGQRRPFGFIWPHGDPRGDEIKSCVKIDPVTDVKEIRDLGGMSRSLLRALQNEQSRTLAVVFDGQVYPVRRTGHTWDSYAILAARRVGKRTHVCVAGLTGPATLGGARLLRQFCPQLQREVGSSGSHTAWLAVKTHVTDAKRKSFRSDERRVEESEIVGDVRYWPSG